MSARGKSAHACARLSARERKAVDRGVSLITSEFCSAISSSGSSSCTRQSHNVHCMLHLSSREAFQDLHALTSWESPASVTPLLLTVTPTISMSTPVSVPQFFSFTTSAKKTKKSARVSFCESGSLPRFLVIRACAATPKGVRIMSWGKNPVCSRTTLGLSSMDGPFFFLPPF